MRHIRILMFAFAVIAILMLMITATAMANNQRASPAEVTIALIIDRPMDVGQASIATSTVDNIFGAMNLTSSMDYATTIMAIADETEYMRDAMIKCDQDAVYRTFLTEVGYAVRRTQFIAAATLIVETYTSNSQTEITITSIDYGYGYAIIVHCSETNVAESRDYSLIIMPAMTALRERGAAIDHKDLVAIRKAVGSQNISRDTILLLAMASNRTSPYVC